MMAAAVGVPSWFDVHITNEPFPTLSYRTGLTVYEESFIRGRLVSRGWNGAGYINPDDIRLDPDRHPTPQVFNVEVEGQLLASHWEWAGLEQHSEEKGLHAIVRLRHARRPVGLAVHTLSTVRPSDPLAGSLIWQAIPSAVRGAWSGVLDETIQSYLPAKDAALWSAGYSRTPTGATKELPLAYPPNGLLRTAAIAGEAIGTRCSSCATTQR